MVMQSVDEERLEHGRRPPRDAHVPDGARSARALRPARDERWAGQARQAPAGGADGAAVAVASGDGRTVRSLEGGLYGQMPAGQAGATAARFVGQWYDEETGLHSNWHRYYDPETGCYLSPEPLGLEGSLKPYAYVDSYPFEAVDLDGLDPVCVIRDRRGRILASSRSGTKGREDQPNLHPAVTAALPPADMTPRLEGEKKAQSQGDCGEARALSQHLERWETKNAPRLCNPPDPRWRNNLGQALGEISPRGGITSGTKNKRYPACENCSQMIPRLFELAGKSPPKDILGRGDINKPQNGIYANDRAVNAPVLKKRPIKTKKGEIAKGEWQQNTNDPAMAAYNEQIDLKKSPGTKAISKEDWVSTGGPVELGTWHYEQDRGPAGDYGQPAKREGKKRGWIRVR
jgi:RHS repeat-associated protein